MKTVIKGASIAALMIGLASASPSKAAVIDINGGLSAQNQNLLPTWAGSSDLNGATEIDLHGNQWGVTNQLDPSDADIGGFMISTPIELTVAGLTATPLVLSWNDSGDFFTETLDAITSIVRSGGSGGGTSLAVDFSGIVNDTAGLFVNDVGTFDFSALDTYLGNNRIGQFNFTEASDGVPFVGDGGNPVVGVGATPEISTLGMLMIGAFGLTYAGYRRQARYVLPH